MKSVDKFWQASQKTKNCDRFRRCQHCLHRGIPWIQFSCNDVVAIAQLVERQIVVLDVAGSNPVSHPQNTPKFSGCFRF